MFKKSFLILPLALISVYCNCMDKAKEDDQKIIAIETQDEKQIQLTKNKIQCFSTIRNMLEDLGDEASDCAIPLPNMSMETFNHILSLTKNVYRVRSFGDCHTIRQIVKVLAGLTYLGFEDNQKLINSLLERITCKINGLQYIQRKLECIKKFVETEQLFLLPSEYLEAFTQQNQERIEKIHAGQTASLSDIVFAFIRKNRNFHTNDVVVIDHEECIIYGRITHLKELFTAEEETTRVLVATNRLGNFAIMSRQDPMGGLIGKI